MMVEFHTLKANGPGCVDSLTIIADRPVDYDSSKSLGELRRNFRDEAKTVVDAMMNHMPGGLVDAIFAEICARKASLLVVTDPITE